MSPLKFFPSDKAPRVFARLRIPNRVDPSWEVFYPDENLPGCRVEVTSKGGAKPAFHFFTSYGAFIPVPTGLQSRSFFAWLHIRIFRARPLDLSIRIIHWFCTEGHLKSFFWIGQALVIHQLGDHFGHAPNKRFVLDLGALIIEHP